MTGSTGRAGEKVLEGQRLSPSRLQHSSTVLRRGCLGTFALCSWCIGLEIRGAVGANSGAMAGGGGHGAHNITHGGLSLHATKGWHSRVGQGMCAVMWLWVLYRAKQDGAVLMGWRHPWEGHGHGGHNEHEEAKHR
ncbi:uncharacterized protein [Physcomitrium patens]